eukprot:GHVU01114132.1.p2 GENE.GHVU01114132.1~~GHVU01114132.1.p2  ORF type:complete len:325 (+),score=66.73 GHVU01114132.1:2286-3260(+)
MPPPTTTGLGGAETDAAAAAAAVAAAAADGLSQSPRVLWTTAEQLRLVQLVGENYATLTGEGKTPDINAKRMAAWRVIAQTISSETGGQFDGEQARKKWQNVKGSAKGKRATQRREAAKTGGGVPQVPKFTAAEESVVQLLGETKGFVGEVDFFEAGPGTASSSDAAVAAAAKFAVEADADIYAARGNAAASTSAAGGHTPTGARAADLALLFAGSGSGRGSSAGSTYGGRRSPASAPRQESHDDLYRGYLVGEQEVQRKRLLVADRLLEEVIPAQLCLMAKIEQLVDGQLTGHKRFHSDARNAVSSVAAVLGHDSNSVATYEI